MKVAAALTITALASASVTHTILSRTLLPHIVDHHNVCIEMTEITRQTTPYLHTRPDVVWSKKQELDAQILAARERRDRFQAWLDKPLWLQLVSFTW
jgi:hypothetical protein